MFGSDAVEKHVYNTVRVLPSVQAAIGNRIYPLQVAPAKAEFPLMIHYAESAPYAQDVISTGILPNEQAITYVVRFIDRDVSNAKIRQPNRDAFEALVKDNAEALVTTEDNEAFSIDIGASSEWTVGTTFIDENGVTYRQKGFSLICNVFRV
jgi:hypothetical protein